MSFMWSMWTRASSRHVTNCQFRRIIVSTDYRDFLDRVDGVDIVTPADNHLAIARDCFEKGKDVFVEKPIALTSEEAERDDRPGQRKGSPSSGGPYLPVPPCLLKIKS